MFIFSDTQVADEMFVEEISTVLNTADVPNLYQPDEKAEILEKMQNAAREIVRTFFTLAKTHRVFRKYVDIF